MHGMKTGMNSCNTGMKDKQPLIATINNNMQAKKPAYAMVPKPVFTYLYLQH